MPFPGTRPAPATPPPAAGPANPPPARPGWGGAQQPPPANPAPAAGPAAGWGNRQTGVQPGGKRSPFAGIQNAEVNRRGSYLNEGDYVLKVKHIEYKDGRNAEFLLIETEVMISSYDPANPATLSHNKEGSAVTIFMKQNDSFLGNVKAFIIAASGFDAQGNPRPLDDIVGDDECNAAISPGQPYAGVYVYAEARQRATKDGGQYTNINYWPIPLDAQGQPDMNRFTKG